MLEAIRRMIESLEAILKLTGLILVAFLILMGIVRKQAKKIWVKIEIKRRRSSGELVLNLLPGSEKADFFWKDPVLIKGGAQAFLVILLALIYMLLCLSLSALAMLIESPNHYQLSSELSFLPVGLSLSNLVGGFLLLIPIFQHASRGTVSRSRKLAKEEENCLQYLSIAWFKEAILSQFRKILATRISFVLLVITIIIPVAWSVSLGVQQDSPYYSFLQSRNRYVRALLALPWMIGLYNTFESRIISQLVILGFLSFISAYTLGIADAMKETDVCSRFPLVRVITTEGDTILNFRFYARTDIDYRFIDEDGSEHIMPIQHIREVKFCDVEAEHIAKQ